MAARLSLFVSAALAAATLSGCASASVAGGLPPGAGGYGEAQPLPPPALPPALNDGLLPEPPASAHPGECYAKVVEPGHPVFAPPSQPHYRWSQSAPPPGAITPVWCLVVEPGWSQPPTWSPDKYGWIRVICDHDITPDRIHHIQARLHAWGYYEGSSSDRYDSGTASAVARFQAAEKIEHGGYLSVKTVEALDAAPPAPPPQPALQPQPMTYASAAYAQRYAYAQPPCCAQPVYQPPVYQQPPCCAPPAPPVVRTVVQPVFVRQVVVQQVPQPYPVYVQPRYAPPVYAPPIYAQACQTGCRQPIYPPPCPTACDAPGGGSPWGPLQGGPMQAAWGGGPRVLSWAGK